ncbi:MAG: ABC transporter permease, partial [Candidatus Berkelbacteria bacterium]|nr:ABC transporter permease [Candidatus Berkelbacteria bacterium]
QAESFAPILNMMASVAVILGTLIVGIVLYSSVNERRRELGVMKAIGFNNRSLAMITYVQALLLVLIGFVIGLAITLAANYLMPRFLDFPISLTVAAVWETLGLSLVISLLSMVPSVRFISKVYPSEAFK